MCTQTGFVDSGHVNPLGVSTKEPNARKVVMANELARRVGYELFTDTRSR